MSAIAWWVIPIAATFVAIAYVTWRSRPGPPEDTHDAMKARERFRRAIEGGRADEPKGDDGDDTDQRS